MSALQLYNTATTVARPAFGAIARGSGLATAFEGADWLSGGRLSSAPRREWNDFTGWVTKKGKEGVQKLHNRVQAAREWHQQHQQMAAGTKRPLTENAKDTRVALYNMGRHAHVQGGGRPPKKPRHQRQKVNHRTKRFRFDGRHSLGKVLGRLSKLKQTYGRRTISRRGRFNKKRY